MKNVQSLSTALCLTALLGAACSSEPGQLPPEGSPDASLFAKDGSTTDTGVTPPADTGVTPPADTGVNTQPDGGINPPFDSGTTPPADTGVTPPADSGVTPPADSGVTPPADSGVGTPDSGTGPTDGGTVTGFDPAQRSATLAQAICAHRTRCEPARFGFDNNDEATCIAEQTADLGSFFNAMVPVLGANTATFNAGQFGACVQAYGSADCDRGLDDGVCDYFDGNQTQTEQCGFNAECGNGLFCSRQSLGTCGTCEPRAAVTESCINVPCAAGSTCLDVGQGNRQCIADTADEGAACGTIPTGLCRGALQCVVNLAGDAATCMRAATNGGQCNPQQQAQPGCNILNNSACVAGTCQATTWNGAGGSCTAPAFCNNTGACDAMTNLCDARPTAGQACAQGRCAPDSFCDGTTCQALVGVGGTCTSGAQCQQALDCVGVTGQQTCQTLTWPTCTQVGTDAGVPDTGADAGVAMDAGTPTDAGGGGNDPFDPVAQSTQLAAAACDFQSRCQPATLEFADTTEAVCATEQAADLLVNFTAFAQTIAGSRATYAQARFDACIAAYANADCETGLEPGVCNFLDGVQAEGQACEFNIECGDGLYCDGQGLAVCGVCAARAGNAEDCSNTPCIDGNTCAQAGPNRVCVDATNGEGVDCGTIGTGLCRGRLLCVEDVFGFRVCTRPAANGQPCATNNQISANCDLLANQACVQGTCQTLTWVGPGNSCADLNACNVNGICDPTLETCFARPTANQPCAANDLCAPDHFCDGTLCQATLAQGGTCTGSAQCEDGLRCVGATGAQTCGTLNWMSCP